MAPGTVHPDSAAEGGSPAGRLNLLLSYAGWEPDPWVDRIPRLLEPMGIATRRVTTGREASEVIRATPIHVAVVDLGLPLDENACPANIAEAEGGVRLLDLLRRLETPPPTVVVKRGRTTRDDRREIAAALRAGAFAVLDRPKGSSDLELLLDAMSRLIRRHYAGRWPGLS